MRRLKRRRIKLRQWDYRKAERLIDDMLDYERAVQEAAHALKRELDALPKHSSVQTAKNITIGITGKQHRNRMIGLSSLGDFVDIFSQQS